MLTDFLWGKTNITAVLNEPKMAPEHACSWWGREAMVKPPCDQPALGNRIHSGLDSDPTTFLAPKRQKSEFSWMETLTNHGSRPPTERARGARLTRLGDGGLNLRAATHQSTTEGMCSALMVSTSALYWGWENLSSCWQNW